MTIAAPSVITTHVVYKVVRATYGFVSRGGGAKRVKKKIDMNSFQYINFSNRIYKQKWNTHAYTTQFPIC